MSWFSKLIGGASSIAGMIPGIGTVASTALGAIGNIADSITAEDSIDKQNKFNANQAQLNRDFQREERLATQEYNKEMWNMQNEYNNPTAQLQRLLDAGLNPNDAIGALGGNTAGSVAASSPMSGSAASSVGSLGSSLLAQAQSQRLAQAQLNNIESETAKNKSQTAGQNIENDWNTASFGERLRAVSASNDKIDSEIQSIINSINNENRMTDSNIAVNDANIANSTAMTESNIAVNEANISKINFDKDMQERYYNWFCSKSQVELQVMYEQLELLRAQTIESRTRSAVNANTANYIAEQTEGQEIANDMSQLEFAFSNATGIPAGTDFCTAAFTLWQQGRFEEFNNLLAAKADEYLMQHDTGVARRWTVLSRRADYINDRTEYIEALRAYLNGNGPNPGPAPF